MKTYIEFIKENNTVYINSEKDWSKISSRTIDLHCSFNQLESLPEIPENLERLSCKNNKLDSLPELPKNLRVLYCYENKLTFLPELPNSLEILYCSDNRLKTLPKLPLNLKELCCWNNPLECLIPEKFYPQQDQDWLKKYLSDIKTYQFQKNLLTKDSNQIQELLSRNILNPQIREEYSNLISGLEWGLI